MGCRRLCKQLPLSSLIRTTSGISRHSAHSTHRSTARVARCLQLQQLVYVNRSFCLGVNRRCSFRGIGSQMADARHASLCASAVQIDAARGESAYLQATHHSPARQPLLTQAWQRICSRLLVRCAVSGFTDAWALAVAHPRRIRGVPAKCDQQAPRIASGGLSLCREPR